MIWAVSDSFVNWKILRFNILMTKGLTTTISGDVSLHAAPHKPHIYTASNYRTASAVSDHARCEENTDVISATLSQRSEPFQKH